MLNLCQNEPCGWMGGWAGWVAKLQSCVIIGAVRAAEREAVYGEAAPTGDQQTQPRDPASQDTTQHTTVTVR